MPTDQRLKLKRLKEMSVQGRQLWLFQVTWCLEFTSWDTCLRPKRLSFLFRVGWMWAKKIIILELLLLITLPQDWCDYISNMVKSWMEFLLVQPVYKAELQSVKLVQTRWWLLSLSSESFYKQGNWHKYINQNQDVKCRWDLGVRWEPPSRC